MKKKNILFTLTLMILIISFMYSIRPREIKNNWIPIDELELGEINNRESTSPTDWWNSSWEYCRNITIKPRDVHCSATLNLSMFNFSNTLNASMRIVNGNCRKRL